MRATIGFKKQIAIGILPQPSISSELNLKRALLDNVMKWLNTFHTRPTTAGELMQHIASVYEKVLIMKNNTFVRSMSLRYSSELDANRGYPIYENLVTPGA